MSNEKRLEFHLAATFSFTSLISNISDSHHVNQEVERGFILSPAFFANSLTLVHDGPIIAHISEFHVDLKGLTQTAKPSLCRGLLFLLSNFPAGQLVYVVISLSGSGVNIAFS